MFSEIKPKQEKVKAETQLISEQQKSKETVVTCYYDQNGEACEENVAYARMDTHDNAGVVKHNCFAYFNNGTLCDPHSSARKRTSNIRPMKYQNFLHYMNYLLNKKRFAYVNAQKID